MKKIAFLFALSIGLMVSAQEKDCNCECPNHHFEKKSNRHHFEKGDAFKSFEELKIKKILKELNVAEKDEEETQKLLEQYFKEKEELVKGIKKDQKKVEELTNEEALARIKTSFEIAPKMLEINKKYTDIFLQKFTPQEVIKIHQIEKKMMEFVMKKHHEFKEK